MFSMFLEAVSASIPPLEISVSSAPVKASAAASLSLISSGERPRFFSPFCSAMRFPIPSLLIKDALDALNRINR